MEHSQSLPDALRCGNVSQADESLTAFSKNLRQLLTSLSITLGPALTGIVIGVAQLGLVGGPLIGGVLTEYATWRW